jgi:hypothetical protein
MTTTLYWKDDVSDLKARALPVLEQPVGERMSARAAAQVLSGIFGHVSRKWTVDVAQKACADLVRCEPAWASSFGRLPNVNGYVRDEIALIATVARALLPLTGADHLRAALAFWAYEDDPSAWQRIAG